jgi:hypothetical protein
MCSADNSVLNCKIWYENGNKKSNHHHHFWLTDPDPALDFYLFASNLQDANKNYAYYFFEGTRVADPHSFDPDPAF